MQDASTNRKVPELFRNVGSSPTARYNAFRGTSTEFSFCPSVNSLE